MLGDKTRERVLEAISAQALPAEFIHTVRDYYLPLSTAVAQRTANNSARPASLVGIQGSQGSGKSTCAVFLKLLLEAEHDLKVVVASIDDFYLTKSARQGLAHSIHPLFETRGVPGTHDVAMMQTMLDDAEAGQAFTVPTFDKSIDDRAPEPQWRQIKHTVDIVLLEGWCVGIDPQDASELAVPVNTLEAQEDPDQVWRREVNRALSEEYRALFTRLDTLITLQAPSFDCVLGWRQLQEEKMISKLKSQGKSTALVQTPAQIERFISHYQRLTEHALLTMPVKADYVLRLNRDHQFTTLERRAK